MDQLNLFAFGFLNDQALHSLNTLLKGGRRASQVGGSKCPTCCSLWEAKWLKSDETCEVTASAMDAAQRVFQTFVENW